MTKMVESGSQEAKDEKKKSAESKGEKLEGK